MADSSHQHVVPSARLSGVVGSVNALSIRLGGDLQKGSDIIHMEAQFNVDFEEVKTVMSEPGKAMMGTATGTDKLPVLNRVAPPTAPQAGMAPQHAAPDHARLRRPEHRQRLAQRPHCSGQGRCAGQPGDGRDRDPGFLRQQAD